MAWADYVLPEERLSTMLALCQPWRAIVANPSATWAELSSIMDAGTVAEGTASSQITTGVFIEEWLNAGFKERPRALSTDSEEDISFSRTSTTGFDFVYPLTLVIELLMPPGIKNDHDAKNDCRRKGDNLYRALLSVSRQNPYGEIINGNYWCRVNYPSSDNGQWYQVVQAKLFLRGVL